MLNDYLTGRVREWGYDGDCESIGTTAKVTLKGRSNNRPAAERVAKLFKALTNGRASIWETRGEFVVQVRGAVAPAGV